MRFNHFRDQLFDLCRRTEPAERFFLFGPFRVRICFLGSEGLRIFFTKAIAHLETEAATPDLTVWVLDRASSGLMLPPPVWDWNEMDGHGTITSFPADRYFANFQQVSGTFTLLDRLENQAVVWLNDVTTLPEWERSFPLRPVLYEWLKESTCLFLHAGAVGTHAEGVLLTGRGGSGKSTSTLACLESSLYYAGDDFVMVDTQTRYVYSLYNVAKLEWSQLPRFPDLAPLVYNTRSAGSSSEKAQVFVWDHFSNKTSNGFPLRAILLPRFTGQTDTTLKPASEAEVLRALAPSTMALLKTSPAYLTKIRQLIQQLPSYWLLTGTDLKQIPATIHECLTTLQTTNAFERALPTG